MPAQQIATTLPLINWTVLAALAIGSFAVVAAARLFTPATKGFLSFTAACAAGFGLLTYLSDTGLPVIPSTAMVTADPAFDAPRRVALAVFVIVAVITTFAIARGGRARVLLLIGMAAGVLALAFGALTWGVTPLGVIPLAVQLLVLAAATGGVFAAMILGHWYLVTPKLPEAPLVLVSRRLLWVVALQVALFVWLRLIVGLVFPLVVSWAALQTAKTRSMESATGLLYINVGTIAAGTILAAGLYFGAGLLV